MYILPATSPGVITVFYKPSKAYHDHEDFLIALSRELENEYTVRLSVDRVYLQIDPPDLAIAKGLDVDCTENSRKYCPYM